MTNAVSSVGAVKSGLCPHGLPPGACPICSGAGGANKVQTADFSAKPGEMSWNECAAIGAFLKSLQNARLAKEADYQARLVNIALFQSKMQQAAISLNNFIQLMSKSALTKPVAIIAQNLVLPVINGIKNLPVNALTFLASAINRFVDISDKLCAIFGELKAALNKRISNLINKVKKKLVSFLFVFASDNESEENELMVELEKKITNLKKMITKITKKITEESHE